MVDEISSKVELIALYIDRGRSYFNFNKNRDYEKTGVYVSMSIDHFAWRRESIGTK
jgi:hypothetical protein